MKETLADLSYEIFFEISEKKPEDVGIKFSEDIHFPSFETVPKTSAQIPLPRVIDGSCLLHGTLFENQEAQRNTMWVLYLASLIHLAAHSKVSDYSVYSKWLENKTPELCWRVIDFIEDIKVEDYLKNKFPEYWEGISEINSVFEQIHLKNSGKNHSKQFSKQFNPTESLIKKIKEHVLKTPRKDVAEIIKIADMLYRNRLILPETSYPYLERHMDGKSAKNVIRGMAITPKGGFTGMVDLADELWVEEKRIHQKMSKKFDKISADLNFDKIEFSPENMGEYLRLKQETYMFLKKLKTQLRSVANIIDSPASEDIGLVAMDKAIQALSAQNNSIQIFEQDEARRADESWVIIMDTSASMKLQFSELKKFALCLSETADELNSRGGKWGFFCFNNNFVIVKDQLEKYNQKTKSRIGGIESNGLSFIPDAITIGVRLLEADTIDKKYLFVISDGQSLGYDGVEKKFDVAIKEAKKHGVSVVGIGIPEGISKYFTYNIPHESLRKTVARFIDVYVEAARSGM